MSSVSLEDFLDSRSQPRPCIVARHLDQLDDANRDVFLLGLANEQAVDTKIAAAFATFDLRVGANSVAKHRRGECCCT